MYTACGIDYCANCDDNVDGILGNDICRECHDNTVLYENECFPCPLAPIAQEAIEQEAEVHEEEELKYLRTIECELVYFNLYVYVDHTLSDTPQWRFLCL